MNLPARHVRLLALVMSVLVLALAISVGVIYGSASSQMRATSEEYGQAFSRQLALLTAEFIFARDLLSLNVLLDEQVKSNPIRFATIYDNDGKLIAQSGEPGHSDELPTLNASITFQNESLGRLVVGLDDSAVSSRGFHLIALLVFLYLALAGLMVFLVWRFQFELATWLDGELKFESGASKPAESVPEPEPPEQLSLNSDCSVLAVKLTPSRLVPRTWLSHAAEVYNGTLTVLTEEEAHLEFTTADHMTAAICCACLIRALCQSDDRIRYRMAIDYGEIESGGALKKRTRYLASLAEQSVIVTRSLQEVLSQEHQNRFGLQSYSNSMLTDGETFACTRADALITRQAMQLLS